MTSAEIVLDQGGEKLAVWIEYTYEPDVTSERPRVEGFSVDRVYILMESGEERSLAPLLLLAYSQWALFESVAFEQLVEERRLK